MVIFLSGKSAPELVNHKFMVKYAMQDGETPYAVAEKKDYKKVCEELQPTEMKKQPEVISDSFQHKYISVSSTSDML